MGFPQKKRLESKTLGSLETSQKYRRPYFHLLQKLTYLRFEHFLETGEPRLREIQKISQAIQVLTEDKIKDILFGFRFEARLIIRF